MERNSEPRHHLRQLQRHRQMLPGETLPRAAPPAEIPGVNGNPGDPNAEAGVAAQAKIDGEKAEGVCSDVGLSLPPFMF